jgi:hypothetical protein
MTRFIVLRNAKHDARERPSAHLVALGNARGGPTAGRFSFVVRARLVEKAEAESNPRVNVAPEAS